MSFYERYLKCCNERGIRPASQDTANKMGCTRSNISTFAKTGITPKGEIVANAAKMLNVSADYLLGITDSPYPVNSTLTSSEAELLEYYRELNDSGQVAARAVLQGLSEQEVYKKDNSAERLA